MTLAVFAAVFAAMSALSFLGGRLRATAPLPSLSSWAIADRSFGAPMIFCVLGGAIFTAYTTIAVPALVYGVGALGFFAVPYTVVFFPLAFFVLPRLWRLAAEQGALTPADLVRIRTGSETLALVVALTGILATMPYVALQLLGLQTLLEVMGVPAGGRLGDLALALTTGVLAVAVFWRGLAAASWVAVAKVLLLFPAIALVVLAVLHRAGGSMTQLLVPALDRLAPSGSEDLVLGPGLSTAYVSLAIGSALALLVYPHVLTAAFSARSPEVLRRCCVLLPAWVVLLGVTALLGLAALGLGVTTAVGHAEQSVPRLVRIVLPDAAAGVVLAAIGVAALVPMAVMSVSVATTFTRNVYVQHIHPTATVKHQRGVARTVSGLVKVGALAFVLGLRTQDAIDLQLLGGVWVIQTLPAVVIASMSPWPHRWALLGGWAVGMTAGTLAVAGQGFIAVLPVSAGPLEVKIYSALAALFLNLVVVLFLTPVLDLIDAPRGLDRSWRVPGAEKLWRPR